MEAARQVLDSPAQLFDELRVGSGDGHRFVVQPVADYREFAERTADVVALPVRLEPRGKLVGDAARRSEHAGWLRHILEKFSRVVLNADALRRTRAAREDRRDADQRMPQSDHTVVNYLVCGHHKLVFGHMGVGYRPLTGRKSPRRWQRAGKRAVGREHRARWCRRVPSRRRCCQ
jgi:hypothetical protein